MAAALILIALERRWPYARGQKLLRAGIGVDLIGYALSQSYLLGLVIARIIGWLDGASGLSRLHLVSGWPVAAQVAFFVVTHDLYIYLFHRLQHRSPLLWRIHEAHHATADVDWLSGARSHAVEILINQTIEFAPHGAAGRGAPDRADQAHPRRGLGHVHPLQHRRAHRGGYSGSSTAPRCTAGTTPSRSATA